MKRQIRRVGTTVAAVLAALTIIIVAPAPAHAAGPPTTSPSAAVRYFSTNFDDYSCASGYACVQIPYGNGWYVFKFYYYGTYYLSDWYGSGFPFNHQTDGAAMRLLNSSGGQIQCIPPITAPEVNFDAVYRIQLTSSAC